MFYLTLLAFALVFYAPPFLLGHDVGRWAQSQEWSTGIPLVPPVPGSVTEMAIMAGGYLIVAGAGAAVMRFLWPGAKPLPLKLFCVPDELGGLNLLIFIAGMIVAVVGLIARANEHIPILGLVTMLGIMGHFWEMNGWQYQEQEMKRRRWARGL